MINLGYLIILAVVAILAIVWVLASMGYTLQKKEEKEKEEREDFIKEGLEGLIKDLRKMSNQGEEFAGKFYKLEEDAKKFLLSENYNKISPALKKAIESCEIESRKELGLALKLYREGIPKSKYDEVVKDFEYFKKRAEERKKDIAEIEKDVKDYIKRKKRL